MTIYVGTILFGLGAVAFLWFLGILRARLAWIVEFLLPLWVALVTACLIRDDARRKPHATRDGQTARR